MTLCDERVSIHVSFMLNLYDKLNFSCRARKIAAAVVSVNKTEISGVHVAMVRNRRKLPLPLSIIRITSDRTVII
jgi:hypothetical protein